MPNIKSYDKLILALSILTFALNLYMTSASADNTFKMFGQRSGPTLKVISS